MFNQRDFDVYFFRFIVLLFWHYDRSRVPFSIKIRARWNVEKKFVRNLGIYYRSPNFAVSLRSSPRENFYFLTKQRFPSLSASFSSTFVSTGEKNRRWEGWKGKTPRRKEEASSPIFA